MKLYLRGDIILDEWYGNLQSLYCIREDTTCSVLLPRRYITMGKIGIGSRYCIVFGTGLKHLEAMFHSISDDDTIQFDAETDDEAKQYVDEMLMRLDKLVAFA